MVHVLSHEKQINEYVETLERLRSHHKQADIESSEVSDLEKKLQTVSKQTRLVPIELQAEWNTTEDEWVARNQAFNNWAHKELGFETDTAEIHAVEMLAKWSGIDNTSKLIY